VLGQSSGDHKIADPRQKIVVDQNVERFQIGMHNVLLMEQYHATHNSEGNPELVIINGQPNLTKLQGI
jgi:hypothetical protein